MSSTLDGAAESAKEVLRAAGNLGNQAGNAIVDGMEQAREEVKEVGDSVSNFAQEAGSAIGDGFDSVSTSISTSLNGSDLGYALNPENQWGWVTLYVVTIVVAVLGNLLFVVASLCTKRTRTTGYYLLMNLSVRDILLACLCLPFALDSEVIAYTWNYGDIYCRVYRFSYYAFLFFLPLTLLFLAFHLFVENCKWNFAGEDNFVPRPWPHTLFLPLIWFFSLAFASPTVFFSQVRDFKDDFYANSIAARPVDAELCIHAGGIYGEGSRFFYIASFLLTFLLPLVLLFIPWWALLVQVFGCCTRKLRSSEFWLSLITLFLILICWTARTPFELWNLHHVLTNNDLVSLSAFIPGLDSESYKAVMKWAVFAPSLLHPFVYFMFSPEARHGVYILFSRCCSCCCSKSDSDVEVASDDEKGRMLTKESNDNNAANDTGNNTAAAAAAAGDQSNVPLQSKQEEEM